MQLLEYKPGFKFSITEEITMVWFKDHQGRVCRGIKRAEDVDVIVTPFNEIPFKVIDLPSELR